MSLYHVYFSNDIFIVFMTAMSTMDQNVDILRESLHLRGIGVACRGVEELHRLLLASLESIVDTNNI